MANAQPIKKPLKNPTISPAMQSDPGTREAAERAAQGPVTLPHGMSENDQPFLTDIMEIRRRAREHIMKGALTPSYEGNVKQAIEILNQALATELVCVLRYRNHAITAKGIQAQAVAEEFWEHSNEELEHADWIAERIDQLGGNPDYNPAGFMSRSHSEYQEGDTLVQMIREDLIAERIAVDTYREIIRYFAAHDPTSRRLMEKILAKEEEHAEDLATLLSTIDPSRKPAQDDEPTRMESSDSFNNKDGSLNEQDETESPSERSA
jgi:bacterioferritin